ncbi:ABC transporter substrate-binding protein [Aquamicrobium sp. LC103]|uniref:ABC transporter substrate-binding protein n=1 Tax=Aquamicrobium sp. LC103 TaxID=1120658 RepID=UPI00063ED248|nr:ABC transporter substrate-binding protein [Aquamicrobium sp. LC103]TKT76172.1 ABC transporter substrate-binding protein [Aquamicrobium sp. LC103]
MRYQFSTSMLGLCAVLASPSMAAEEPVKGGVVGFALTSDIRTLDASRTDANTDSVLHHIYDQFVAYRDDMTVGPAIADSWEVSEDGRTYTFKLREGVVYHNGDPVVAGDVKWLWDRRMSAGEQLGTPWFCASSFDGSRGLKVETVEVVDEGTITFTLDAPNTLFLTQLANTYCNFWVASPKNVDAQGNWIDGSAIGSGPFQFKEWRKEQYVSLTRFDGYVPSKHPRSGYSGDRTTYVDEVRFSVIPDKTAAETALFAGQIDVVTSLQASRMDAVREMGATVQHAPGLSPSAILLQTKDPLLSNPKLRLAMAHAIDLEQITAVKTAGLAVANPSGVPETSAIFDDRFKEWPAYDPELAKKLLAETGYKGEPIKLQANQRFIGMYENAILVQAMLSAAGFNIQLDVLDWAAQFENYISGNYQMQSFGYSALPDPLIVYGRIIGDKETDATIQWDDEKAREIYTQALTEMDLDKRKELLLELHAMMKEEAPMLILYYYPVIEAVSPNLVDYVSWSGAAPRAWGVWKRK